jgi:hypothetical protein
MGTKEAVYDRLISMWGIQDSLLQSYRNIFLTSQSVLLSVAVFVAQGARPALAFLLALIGLPLVWLWHSIVTSRGYHVWFFHLHILRLEAGMSVPNNLFKAFKDWQGLAQSEQQKQLHGDALGRSLTKSKTRSRLDLYLPMAFAACWLILSGTVAWLTWPH